MLNTHKRIKVFCSIYSSIGFTKMGGIYIVHVMCLTRWWMQLLDTTKKQSDWPGSWFNLMFESILDPWNHQAVDISGETVIFNSYFTNSRIFSAIWGWFPESNAHDWWVWSRREVIIIYPNISSYGKWNMVQIWMVYLLFDSTCLYVPMKNGDFSAR